MDKNADKNADKNRLQECNINFFNLRQTLERYEWLGVHQETDLNRLLMFIIITDAKVEA